MNYRFLFKENEVVYAGEVVNNRLISYIDTSKFLIGNIYRARVEKYIKSLDAYILEVGLDKKGLLRKNKSFDQIKLGDDILCELIVQHNNDKLYEFTQNLTLSDGYIVLSLYGKSDRKFPMFLRTIGKNLFKEEIDNRYDILEREMVSLLNEKNFLPTPKLLKSDRFITNFINGYSGEIKANFDILNIRGDKSFNPNYDFLLSKEISSLKSKKVEFENGNIVIDRLEALSVIDVNSGYFNTEKSKEEMSIECNLNALKEIAIQISLREIKKMVLIDFIRVDKSYQKKIIEELNHEFEKYNIKSKILGFSRLGLLEIIIE